MSSSLIVLAAGLGKRMHSSLPKVMMRVLGRPMLFHILDQVSKARPKTRVAIVVGHQKETVISAVNSSLSDWDLQIDFIEQKEQLGTGHAVRSVMETSWGEVAVQKKEEVLVLPGDLPLLTEELVKEMFEPLKKGAALKLLTSKMSNPTGYGRIVRKGKAGPVQKIVEEKDAKPREKLIQEVGLSIYTFQAQFLRQGVLSLTNKNAQKEYYLTDLIQMAVQKKRGIVTAIWENSEDVRGVNNPFELAEVSEILQKRILKAHALSGVRFFMTNGVVIEPCVKIAADVTIYPGVVLEGKTEIASGTLIGPHVVLKNTKVGSNCHIKAGSVCEDSVIEADVAVGPYAHFRPESQVKQGAKIGNFVELKKTIIGEKTAVSHLSYLGDAVVGDRVNIGCGFVTCNFDGRVIDGKRKHQTTIEDDVFVGSDCQTVAPVTLKKGSYVASGSTVTEEVPEDSLAIARSRQVTKVGYAKKLRGE